MLMEFIRLKMVSLKSSSTRNIWGIRERFQLRSQPLSRFVRPYANDRLKQEFRSA